MSTYANCSTMTNNPRTTAETKNNTRDSFTAQLKRFVQTGIAPEANGTENNDALTQFVLSVMQNELVAQLVQADAISARIFRDTMELFIHTCLQKREFIWLRAEREFLQIEEVSHWSLEMREIGWQSLLATLSDKYERQGFAADFYEREFSRPLGTDDDALWDSFLADWMFHLLKKLQETYSSFINSQAEIQTSRLLKNMQQGSQYARDRGIGQEMFNEAWSLMNGRWNNIEFERLLKVALLHRKFPLLNDLFEKVGRTADINGNSVIHTTTGTNEKMPHATKSDINGISQGRDFSALLPSEWAQFLDSETEDVFMQKYFTGHLQTFQYQSAILNPTHHLQAKRAIARGPLVVCVDTSGSMVGQPERIAMSLLMRLSELCASKHRNCYLIGFSVHAHPMDITKNRGALLEFFNKCATGDTDSRHMLNCLFEVLSTESEYAGADVLWITDFRIPIPPIQHLQKLESARSQGTKFYGLQIGIAENRWKKYFDMIYKL